jgi:hypothetical protein
VSQIDALFWEGKSEDLRIGQFQNILLLESRNLLPGILNLGLAGVGVFSEVEEFCVALYGLFLLPLLFMDIPQLAFS